MPWSTTSDVHAFIAAVGEFLSSRPIEHSPLLTEADHLRRNPEPDAGQAYGWWTGEHGEVAGAFLQAPRHPPILTPLPAAAVDELVAVLPVADGLGCDVTTVDAALEAWQRAGVTLQPRHRLVVHRLDRLRPPPLPPGSPRPAGPGDTELLQRWFGELMAANPGDASDRSYVIDDPLAEGRIVLWEADGVPEAMAGRSRVVDGMTRLGATYVPTGDARVETAVLAAGSAAAAAVAEDVLVLSARSDLAASAQLAALGYRAVRERILLAPVI
ncbi:hypothetical protein SFC88_06170 [Nocardioides sp. HM23]|uniref:hypothetical protein n=1 Tax=Nocardioides bizhenqiangii TaxID=3095076 RepID=UPI002ACA4C30|nr:hypothetical protein [Nocardioides sp. HM23]MDZ5620398.1 hypothetical protein [Nocardioides sp. HM23]